MKGRRVPPNDQRVSSVVVNGLPGKMATAVAEHIFRSNKREYPFMINDFSVTGPDIRDNNVSIVGRDGGEKIIYLCRSNESRVEDALCELKDGYPDLIIVDYTHPDAVNKNAKLYCSLGIPFVMGTTGGDRKKLIATIENSDNCAVIAPNMAKQIVMFQAMMKYAAENFPKAFEGYVLQIVESHQKGKPDTSGTARAMVEYFNTLGIPFKENQIVMIREPEEQRKMGVPENALAGHGWHTYTLRTSDGGVGFQFTHNVNGRSVYAQGTLDAIRFLSKNIVPGKVYSMIDVLQGG